MAKKKNRRNDSPTLGKFLKFLLVCTAIACFLSASYFLPRLGAPKKTSQISEETVSQISEELLDVLAQSERLERIYRESIAIHDPTEEDIKTLDRAIESQQKYIANTPNDPEMNRRLDELQTLRQDALAKPLYQLSREAEDQGVLLEQKREYVAARTKVREAINLQKRINTEFPRSQYHDVNRASQLERVMQVLIARPILEESLESERIAQKAEKKEDWTTALKAYRKAADLQRQLNMGYVQLRFADLGRTQKLDAAISSLESVGLFNQVNDLSKQGEQALAAGQVRQAAEYFQNAYYAQQELNKNYPQSRFADGSRLESLNTQMQTAQSTPLAEDIQSSAEKIRQALRERQTAKAQFLLETLQPKIASFKESFPLSNLIEGELSFEIQFLSLKAPDFGRLQKQILDNLITLPSGVSMLRTEVPQALFIDIARTNPSRNRGDSLPVETVNYEEAVDFCRRVQFLLGVPVRLPTQEEYREAVGSLRYADLNALSWHSENAQGKTHPVGTKTANEKGFCDLLGNVGEWTLQASPDDKEAVIMGGSALTPVDRIADLPAVSTPLGERNRLNGFRFVVDNRKPKADTPAKTQDKASLPQ